MTAIFRTSDGLEALVELDTEADEVVRLIRGVRMTWSKDPPIPSKADRYSGTRRYVWTGEKKDHLRIYEEAM